MESVLTVSDSPGCLVLTQKASCFAVPRKRCENNASRSCLAVESPVPGPRHPPPTKLGVSLLWFGAVLWDLALRQSRGTVDHRSLGEGAWAAGAEP